MSDEETIDYLNHELFLFDAIDPVHDTIHIHELSAKTKEPDYEALCPHFAWAPVDLSLIHI